MGLHGLSALQPAPHHRRRLARPVARALPGLGAEDMGWARAVPHVRAASVRPAMPEHIQPLPMTPAQMGLAAESLAQRGAGFNVEQVVLRLPRSAPAPADLAQAFAAAAALHDSLRLVIRQDDDSHLLQALCAEIPVALVEQDWTGLPDPDQTLADWLAADRAQGFAFDGGPLWRLLHARTGPDSAIVVWTIHHAITDLGSMAQVLDTVAQGLSGQVAAAPQTASIRDVIEWMRAQDQPPDGPTAPDPQDAASLPALVQAGPAGAARSQARMTCQLVLGAGLRAALEARTSAAGATLLNALQLAFGLALARWGGADRAVFGLTHAAWAAWAPARAIPGCRLATLPFVQDLSGARLVGAQLAQLRAQTRDQRRRLGRSPAQWRAELGLDGATPLFEAVLAVAPKALPASLAAPLWAQAQVSLHEKGAAPLTLAAHLEPDLELVLEHDPALLPAQAAQRFLAHVGALLQALADAADDTPLQALDMLGSAERAALLARALPDVALPDSPPCPATRFAEIAARCPDALALTCAQTGTRLSYAALAARMQAVAGALQAAGHGTGARIALDLPRSPDFVAALLGVWAAGAIAVPLDQVLPPEQKQALCAQAGVACVIGPGGLDPARLAPAGPVALPPLEAARPAYLIFTSGSTGQPKAVLGSCGALSAHADAVAQAFGLTPQDRCLSFAGLGFDVMLEEIVPTLLAGAHLVLRSDLSAQSLPAFHAMVAEHGLSVLNLPASFWHVLVDDMGERGIGLPPAVRLMVTGSERLRPDALARFRALAPDCAFINGYGPTEATITSTAFRLPAGAPALAPGQDVPIGTPLGHARAYIRALDGTLAPEGVEGELWIGGPAVTLGYLDRPDLTAQVFQPDPFHPGGRVYNTGDRALWRADGTLAFLGRRDRQVKLRGQRLDLNGIERVLAELPGVGQVHVALDRAGSGQARLLAWLVPATGAALDLAACQALIDRRLQPAARPALMHVEALPLTPNGKIATARLPRPQMQRPAATRQSDALTRMLAQLMAQVLAQDHVDPDQDFHDLGGDSLSAMRLAMLAERALGQPVLAMDIHRNPSPAALATALRAAQPGSRLIVPIQPEGTQPAFFAVHVLGPRESQWRPLAQALGPDWPVYGISVGAPRSLDEIDIPSIAEVYFQEIQTHHPEGALMLGATSMASYYAYDLAQRLVAAGRDVRLVVAFDAMGPGGRPALRGWGKVAAHLRQIARKGLGHLRAVRASRMLMRQIAQDAAHSHQGSVTGINIVQATIAAVDRYQPAPIDAPMLVLRADSSFWDAPEAHATALGWAQVAAAGVRLVDVPGEHLTILSPGNVEVLAERLKQVVRDQERGQERAPGKR